LNNAARRPLQAGQTKPSGQRRLHKNAAHFASSGNACWNSVSERALAIEGPFAPPLAAAHQDTIFRGTWDNGISHHFNARLKIYSLVKPLLEELCGSFTESALRFFDRSKEQSIDQIQVKKQSFELLALVSLLLLPSF